ncbi:TadE/TadG family type IV pilus assembly protein [Pararhizobium mangrovi]|uniref:TadE-like domain-containing protein n=1 Tax=Pararhizobium mangrovi TaxID=2590452 RepID=A0A506U2Y2_9HYPH|nr:hypothetical protein FJU11_09075 [Pararhizobium mangrovi]
MLHRPKNILSRLWKDRGGAAAIEFAFVLPVLVVLYLGLVEASFAIVAHQKTEETASTIGDLIAQDTELSDDGIDDLFDIATATMYPYSVRSLRIQVAGLRMNDEGHFTRQWHHDSDDNMPGLDADTLGPALSRTNGNFLVVARTFYDYQPMTRFLFGKPLEMKSLNVTRARLTTDLECTGCTR